MAFLLPHYPPPTDSAGEWPAAYPPGGLLFYGDNKEVLATLVKDFRGKVKLIYIDPPFDSGADYVRKVQLRGVANVGALAGEGQSLLEQVQYSDIWANDSYLQFMYERLLLLKELLSEDGAIWLHCDWHKTHHLRMLIDEVFGSENFRNEVIWAYPGREMHIENKLNAKHDTLLFTAKSQAAKINMRDIAVAYDREERLKSLRRKVYKDGDGTEWVWETRRQAAGQESYKRTVDDILADGHALNDVWDDLQFLRGNDPERTSYPTQKPEVLLVVCHASFDGSPMPFRQVIGPAATHQISRDTPLERIIRASSNPGDLALDCFIGSGTTAAVAQKLGRRWIGCDINKGAIQTTSRRLQQVITEQGEAAARPRQGKLADGEEASVPAPTQLAFTIHRVNDYDLAIQHNELAALVGEQLGITRLPTDGFFDGTRGANLVKIVPFDHAVGPLDLEAIKEELLRRREETRGVAVVALGKQLAADAWLTDWNQYRAVAKLGEDNRPVEFVNTIEIIDLRTDARHGGFIAHQPASAAVAIIRQDEEIRVTIEAVISPTIAQRLQLDLPMFQAKITDWRAVVNSVEIDTRYDGAVFTIALSDIPERKSDLVAGCYALPAPAGSTTVAVKITDMLGEEILVTKDV